MVTYARRCCQAPLEAPEIPVGTSLWLLRRVSSPSYNTPLCEAPMPFSIRPYRRFPVQCAVTYNTGPFRGQGTLWNLSSTGWRLSGDLPMRPGETLALTVTLPNEQCIEILQAVVRWSRGQEFAVETVLVEQHTHARLQHYVNRLVEEPAASLP
jgi:hypothetical protein